MDVAIYLRLGTIVLARLANYVTKKNSSPLEKYTITMLGAFNFTIRMLVLKQWLVFDGFHSKSMGHLCLLSGK